MGDSSSDLRPAHIREGWRTVTPYLMVEDVAPMLRFLEHTFGAVPTKLTRLDDGTLVNAAIEISDCMVTISRATPQFAAMPATLYVYVGNADAAMAKALECGGTALAPVDDKPYGDRNGCVRDPQGNHWWIATHIEEVGTQELAHRVRAYLGENKP